MPRLSHLHQLFSAEHCQSYIRMLRWQDRPLQCPRCHSQDISPWGTYHYRAGCKRYWCHGGRRTFNDLTHTLLHRSQRALPHWILAICLLCLSCSSRRMARELGLHLRTSYRGCWWLRHAALSYERHRQLEGTVEADELYHTAGSKGQAQHGGKKPLGRRPRRRRKKREPGALRQRPARDYCVGQSSGVCRGARSAEFHDQHGANSRRPRRACGQSIVYRLHQ